MAGPPGRTALRPILSRVPLFHPDTTVATSYEHTRDQKGLVWTTFTVHHADLPIEWVEDMHAWWAYQLAFLEAEFMSPD